MPARTWTFTPSLAPTLAGALVLVLLLALGHWQLDRAREKEDLHAESLRKVKLAPVELDRGRTRENGDAMAGRRVIVRGRYITDKVYLLDNQVLKGAAGYLVYMPFEIAGTGLSVMINRGWIPAGPYRDRVPDVDAPAGRLTLTGRAFLPAAPALLNEVALEAVADDVYRVQAIRLDELGGATGLDLVPYAVRLDPGSPSAYADAWTPPSSGRERHLGYAFQWFALAGALLVIWLYYSFHRRDKHD